MTVDPLQERAPVDFIRAILKRAADAAKASAGRSLRLGPVATRLHEISGGGNDLVDRILRAAKAPEAGVPAARMTLIVSVGTDSPLGPPPATWPFSIDSRASFQRTVWSPQDGVALTSDEQTGVWNLMDLREHIGLLWIADPRLIPSWEYGAPLRHHLHWVALQSGASLVHAAAFLSPGGGILLSGPGGSGKSTTSVAALAAGWKILSEDLCWADASGAGITVRCTYSSLKVAAQSRSSFAFVDEIVRGHDHEEFEKTLVYLDGDVARTAAERMKGIFCLSGAFASKTTIRPCSKAVAFQLVAPSTLFLMRTSAMETVSVLRKLIDRLPVFHITLGADPREAIDVLGRFAGSLE
ncbi:hypothetical protein ABGN05_09580 [Aquibium sp. LZ166]|uniref:Serine kinase n=1 Tax=Aquibium pacificus TaxID=3153579 RepID=A0ABV3SHU9_9HYPH